MALPARTLQTNQREKPRDVPRDFALPYPAECPALVTVDDVRRAWAVLFLPAFAAGNVDSFDLQVQSARHELTGKTWQWYPVRRKEPSLEYVRSAVDAHLNAGETGKPWHLDGEGLIRSIGAKFKKDALTCILNVDLDGRYDVHEVLRSFESVGVTGLLMSSSGRPGRYRLLVFLDRWYTIDELQALGNTLCESLGFKVESGALELYPSHGNGRLPGCLGSLTRYCPTNLDVVTNLSLPEFMQEMHDLPRVNLAQIVNKLKFAAERSEHDARMWDDFLPEFEKLDFELGQASNDQRTSKRKPTRGAHVEPPEYVLRWEKSGFAPGERQRGLHLLAMHAWFRKKNQAQTVDYLSDLVRRGLIGRSRIMDERQNPIGYQIKDLPRIVRDTFAICATFTAKKAVNAASAPLAEDDFAVLDADVQRVATQQDRTWTAKRCKAFVWYIVQLFKGAMVAGHVDNEGRPIARIHWIDWQVAAGNRADYKAIRDALGWFVPIVPEGSPTPNLYCSRARARAEYGDDSKAHATTYAFVPRLTCEVPKRPLATNWDDAVKVARRRLSKRHKTG